MKARNRLTMAIIALAMVISWGCKKKDQTEVTEPVQPQVEQFDIVDLDTFTYVAVEMTGGYEKHGEAISKLQNAVKEQQIAVAGPMFGVYWNSPEDTTAALLKWEVGFQATLAADPAAPLVAKKWDWGKGIVNLYTGPYQGTGDNYKKIFAFLDTRSDVVPAGAMMERWMDENPDLVEPDDLRTEIWVPVTEPEPEPAAEPEKAAEEPAAAAEPVVAAEEKPAEEPAAEPEKPATKKGGGKKGGGKKTDGKKGQQ